MSVHKVAVLDDYSGFSKPQFAGLGPQFEVHYFTDTLPSYNHADTPQSAKDALVQRLEPFSVISTMRERTPFPAELINRLPNLKLLLTTGDHNRAFDMNAITERGIYAVGTTQSAGNRPKCVGESSTIQHCVAMVLAVMRNIAQDDASVKAGGWQTGVGTGLPGKTLGVVGLGKLGASLATILHSIFGMKVIAWSANLTQEKADVAAKNAGFPVESQDGEKTFKVVSKDELFTNADVVSLQIVLSDRTRGIITGQDLAKMKPSSFFINTSRGPLVVEKDLFDTLNAGRIRGAALDVYDLEPLPGDSPWRTQDWGKNGKSMVLLTPHMGYVEEDILVSWYKQQVAEIIRWADGDTNFKVLVHH